MISEWVFPSLNIPTQRSSEDYIKHASQITFSDLVLGGSDFPHHVPPRWRSGWHSGEVQRASRITGATFLGKIG